MSKFFNIPWATGGDKTAIPDVDPGSGVVNWTDGWGLNYELDQVSEPSALDVSRDAENQFKFDVTTYLKQLQQTGLLPYDALFDYLVNAYVQGTDGNIYRALVLNGPSTTPVDPVGDTGGTWSHIHADLQNYDNTFVYEVGDYVARATAIFRCVLANGPGTVSGVVDPLNDFAQVNWEPNRSGVRKYSATLNYQQEEYAVGTDGRIYMCMVGNGPADLPVVNPVGDGTGTWDPLNGDVWLYDAFLQYRSGYYAKGADGLLYRATADTLALDPVGDISGVWVLVSANNDSPKVSVFTAGGASHPLDPRTQSFKVTVTGSGGGGGGADATGVNRGIGSSGGGGGTAITTYDRTTLTGNVGVTVGTGGTGGVVGGPAATPGSASVVSGTGITSSIGNGGGAGVTGVSSGANPIVIAGPLGGVATGGDINISGSGAGDAGTTGGSNNVAIPSTAGGSIWGAGAPGQMSNADGDDAVIPGTGGGGATAVTTDRDGGDGANGIVIIEEFF